MGPIYHLICRYWLPPEYLSTEPDETHPHRRRFTRRYRRKKAIAKTIWIGCGLVMLTHPVVPFVALVSLVGTFSAFVVLDETA
jgi:hypothetical protein